jgi:hypothetical protein
MISAKIQITKKQKKYPRLLIFNPRSNIKGFVAIFVTEYQGFVINPGNSQYIIGQKIELDSETSKDWILFEETITLSNK